MIDQYLVVIRVDVEREDDNKSMSESNVEHSISKCLNNNRSIEGEVIEVNHIDTLIDGVPVGKQD